MSTDPKGNWDQSTFDKKMKESKNELETLKAELNALMVKSALRALRTYQATRNEPLKPNEITNLTKYELNNVIFDLQAAENMAEIHQKVKEEWAKQKKP
jgi:hypothetical protein